MLRYGTVWLEPATSIQCVPTPPEARIVNTEMPRVVFAEIAPANLLS
jgi:hypothetical protein